VPPRSEGVAHSFDELVGVSPVTVPAGRLVGVDGVVGPGGPGPGSPGPGGVGFRVGDDGRFSGQVTIVAQRGSSGFAWPPGGVGGCRADGGFQRLRLRERGTGAPFHVPVDGPDVPGVPPDGLDGRLEFLDSGLQVSHPTFEPDSVPGARRDTPRIRIHGVAGTVDGPVAGTVDGPIAGRCTFEGVEPVREVVPGHGCRWPGLRI